MCKERTFNIEFRRCDGGGAEDYVWDDVQFDIEETSFTEMVNDILSLFNAFCAEHGYGNAKIEYVEEVFDEVFDE